MLIVPDADSLAIKIAPPPGISTRSMWGRPKQCGSQAFNQKTTPEIDGEVSMVSTDITQDQRAGSSYYTGRVMLKPEELAKLGSAKLLPGMPVEVFIKTAGRTALSYLLKPLQDQAGRAFKGALSWYQ